VFHKPLTNFELKSILNKNTNNRSRSKTQRDSVFQPEFREDLKYWVETDRKTTLRIFQLIESIMRDPFQGIGKPEPLKFLGAGVWSRRITQEHRLVYVVAHDRIDFLQARYHY
jgi:toxin YoeB